MTRAPGAELSMHIGEEPVSACSTDKSNIIEFVLFQVLLLGLRGHVPMHSGGSAGREREKRTREH